jgi:hypothetical protein
LIVDYRAMLRSLSLAVALAIGPLTAASDVPLSGVETEYADWLDATSAVSTLDSGLMARIDGRDRSEWDRQRQELAAILESQLKRLNVSALGPEDARALGVMRKGLVSNALDSSESGSGSGRCADRIDTGSAGGADEPTALQVALYACFEEIGNRISFEGHTIVRTTALQWLQELDDAERRKRLFLAFEPLWTAVNGNNTPDSPYRRMIDSSAAQARRGGSSPIGDAAATLGMSTTQVERWLEEILEAWGEHNRGAAREPWDYWYSSASAARELSHAIRRDAVLPISERFYSDLGADLRRLGVLHDLDVRPGKAPLAYTDLVRIGRRAGGDWRPAIPRVSANYQEGGLFVLNELIHEDGHAVHYAAVRTRPAFYSLGDDLFFEAFADVPAWSCMEPAWQHKYLGRSASAAASLRELYSDVMLDVAWGLFELRMLRDPTADPNAIWSDITSRYLNIVPHPEISWWALRVQLVRWPGYMINYGLGAVLTADIRQRIAQAIGPFDTGNARWYAWTSTHLLQFGSSLETADLLRRFLGRPVSTEAILNQLRRLGREDARTPGRP